MGYHGNQDDFCLNAATSKEFIAHFD